MNTSIKTLFVSLLLCASLLTHAQTKKVLFIGNSYTYANNLPQVVASMAASTNDTLIHDSNTIGGYSLGNHKFNTVTLNKIQAGGWDHVVLQEQSQTYAFFQSFPAVFPNAVYLDSMIKQYSPCEQTIFYMTWGYKNGDSYLCTPPECDSAHEVFRTYEEMDSVIHANYMFAGDSLNAIVSPVGAVRRYLHDHSPTLELYSPDGSHPSEAGTYAAACCFYTAIFRKDPALVPYNFTLSPADAATIRNAAHQVVYNDLLHWGIGAYDSLLTDSCQALGMPSIQDRSWWRVYPNPAHDVLTIECKNASNQTIRLCNYLGTVVREIHAAQMTLVDLAALPAGLYFLCSGQGEQTFKFVKQ